MSHWTDAAALKAQLIKRWDKGDLLAGRDSLFPLRLALRGPSSSDLSERFAQVRDWAGELLRDTGDYRVVMREVRHRVIGSNPVPSEVWVDTLEQAVRWIGKGAELRDFDALLAATRESEPALEAWVRHQPLRALALQEQWPQLLALVGWIRRNPRPGIYLRQIDLPGIHSKFVESQRGVVSELLDLALPPGAIDASARSAAQFGPRYGFRDKPARVRFRWLDPRADWVSGGDGDYTVSRQTFARLAPPVRRVFVTENEINFLAFPALDDALVVFGAGYGFDALADAEWLARCELSYWGDIDTHGFAILDQLRARHPHAVSLLMDRATLLAHQPQWTAEPQPVLHDLSRLAPAEAALYDELRWLRLAATPIRLEQERIGFGWVGRAVVG